ncbi:exodeoxyribonuclease VII small subunit [Collinsella bouchesdurhonensis]|uniref:exodeoxyribonuclease VII small subunit n=1 Tax=Collinsella bouchesdurhonensis TaxID=1907654 RepID=UPI003F8A5995
MSESTVHTFDDVMARMDDIVAAVRAKDASLEHSLDLFDEAIALGSKAVEMVDNFELSDREAAQLEETSAKDDSYSEPAVE